MFPEKQPERQIIAKNSFAKRKTVIESKMLKGFNQLVIITEIQVYKNEKGIINESGLTTPRSISSDSQKSKEFNHDWHTISNFFQTKTGI